MLAKFVKENEQHLKNLSYACRSLSMDMVLNAKSGHIGMPLGCAEIGTLLYFAVMKHDSEDPHWVNRDRFVLSAGHGSALQYSLLHLAGYPLPLKELKNFRQLTSLTPGHPEYPLTPGVECTTGPLGQGLATATGLAIAEKFIASQTSGLDSNDRPLISHKVFVLAGDGCLMEGLTHESCSLAGTLGLNNLIVFYDQNNITIDGKTDVSFTEDVEKRFKAYGWKTFHADGHDFSSLAAATESALEVSNSPSIIICKTIPGNGSEKWANNHKVHGNPMSADDVLAAKKFLLKECGLTPETTPFQLPKEVQKSIDTLLHKKLKPRIAGIRKSEEDILKSLVVKDPSKFLVWSELTSRADLSTFTEDEVDNLGHGKMATRVASGKALATLSQKNLHLLGGSADLAGSTLTTFPEAQFFSNTNPSGRNIHFGVREHAMAAICNGISLHSGLRGFGATFTVFSDYMRPAIRMAAIMELPSIFIFTHDSFYVGEDGPTHQPIEHLPALRAIPNLKTFRPADSLETIIAWEEIGRTLHSPSCLFLTRQDLPDLDLMLSQRRDLEKVRQGMHKGGYILKDFKTDDKKTTFKKLIVVASGSEVSLALESAHELESLTDQTVPLSVRVISCPSPERLTENPEELEFLVPKNHFVCAIEAASKHSWGQIIGRRGHFYGMTHYGSSAPAAALAGHFGFNKASVVSFIKSKLELKD